MSEIEEEKIIDVGSEEFIDSDEWKDNFLKQGKWIRLFWMLAFSFGLLPFYDSTLVDSIYPVSFCFNYR